MGQRVARLLIRASVVGIAVSLLVHLVLLVIAALLHVGTAQAGGAGREATEVEFAVITETELQQLQEAAIELGEPTVVDDAGASEAATPAVLDTPSIEDPVGVGEEVGGAAAGLGGAGGDLDGLGLDVGGSGGAASFFGVEARGLRFAYIVDVSGSMAGEKLTSLQRELGASVNVLLEHMSFFVVCFSSEAFALGGREKWVEASETGKRWGMGKIAELQPLGGTNPAPGFSLAFRMKPRPDAIYFMTDGQFDPLVVDLIGRLNKAGGKVPIHCITFGDRSAEELMRRIAAESGGSYTHIEEPG